MAIPGLRISDESGRVLVPAEIQSEILGLVREKSVVQTLAKSVPMTRDIRNLRFMASGTRAYWVGAGETKPKSTATFDQIQLIAKKIAIIVPVEDELLEDADVDLAQIIRDDAVAAIGEALDTACLGYESPSPFDVTISGSVSAENTIPYTDIPESVNEAFAAIEANGYRPTAMVTHPRVKGVLRGLTDSDGRPLFLQSITGAPDEYLLYGVPIYFTRVVPVSASPAACEILIADWDYVIMGNRNLLEVTISKEATLTQGTQDPINLFEQDMTAFRFVLRKAFTVYFPEKTLAKVTGVEV